MSVSDLIDQWLVFADEFFHHSDTMLEDFARTDVGTGWDLERNAAHGCGFLCNNLDGWVGLQGLWQGRNPSQRVSHGRCFDSAKRFVALRAAGHGAPWKRTFRFLSRWQILIAITH